MSNQQSSLTGFNGDDPSLPDPDEFTVAYCQGSGSGGWTVSVPELNLHRNGHSSFSAEKADGGYYAQLVAIKQALFVLEDQVPEGHVCVKNNCESAVEAAKGRYSCPDEAQTLVEKIRSKRNSFSTCQFKTVSGRDPLEMARKKMEEGR